MDQKQYSIVVQWVGPIKYSKVFVLQSYIHLNISLIWNIA